MSRLRIRWMAGGRILQPCSLEGYAYQIDPYISCEHRCLYCYAGCPVPPLPHLAESFVEAST